MENDKKKIGNLGEDLACKFLRERGFKIVERNFRKKFGEIDIIAEKRKVINFVEVKTVAASLDKKGRVIAEPLLPPETKVDERKLRRIGRVIKVYIEHRRMEPRWEFKIFSILFDRENKVATIKVIEDVVPEY